MNRGAVGPPTVQVSHQRGIVLLIALVAVIALAFAGMSLVRAVAAGIAIDDNINLRRQAAFAASAALEHDVVALLEDRSIDTMNDDAAHNYVASRQPGEDRRGVPRALLVAAAYPAGASILDVGDGLVVRHVIERLCVLPGAPVIDRCALSPPSVEAASGAPPPGEPAREPAYRITMRVEGPAGAATFVQAIVSAAHANPRVSWQVLDE
ncbi:MAG TPA: hypothetical protein VJ891_03790 [Casimicrobiaceae bacterium]|nr:hypothetical protein [Casimicrobiaceae bacterium]